MRSHVHHVHLFASDLERSIAFYRDCLGAEVALDTVLAGVRNVFLRIGRGRIHLYDQPPRDAGRGAIHHVGIQTDDLAGLVRHMTAAGVVFRKEISEQGAWRYVMALAPDGVLLELFEVNTAVLPPQLVGYFES